MDLLPLLPWLLLGVPAVSLYRWRQIRARRDNDYAYFVEWKEFPITKIAVGKLAFFSLLGAASMVYAIPLYKTVIAISIIGVCGYYIETTISVGRPVPTPGYKISKRVCANCSAADHDGCTNLRMLEGFEKGFMSDGYRSPVCCCGFRLGRWEEVAV